MATQRNIAKQLDTNMYVSNLKDFKDSIERNKADEYIQDYLVNNAAITTAEDVCSLMLTIAIVKEDVDVVNYILSLEHASNIFASFDDLDSSPITQLLRTSNEQIQDSMQKYFESFSELQKVDLRAEDIIFIVDAIRFSKSGIEIRQQLQIIAPIFSETALAGVTQAIDDLGLLDGWGY